MDVLSDVIATISFSSSVFLDARFTAPWCIEAQITPDDCKPFGAVPVTVIAYHYVVSGDLYLSLGKDARLQMQAGDVILLPGNERHILGSKQGLRPASIDHLIQPADGSRPALINIGGGGEPCHIICGFLGCDIPGNPLIDSLPPVLHLTSGTSASGNWIGDTFQRAAQEFVSGGIGSATILGKLAELLFVEALRKYLATLPDSQTGWLAGLRDPRIGRALALIHREPARHWSAGELARSANLSRSAFADRFTRMVGMPPMRYLGKWRLQLAAIRLRESPHSIGRIAGDVGYESEAAFTRAFRRAFHCTPGEWRRSSPDGAVAGA